MPWQPSSLIVSQTRLGKLSREEALLSQWATQQGIPVVTGSVKQMERGRLPVTNTSLVAGAVPFVLHALRRLAIPVPLHIPYPDALSPWLHRRVWRQDKLLHVLQHLNTGGRPVFVKPAQGWKRFTGFVAEYATDYRFGGASKNAPVWVSDVLEFVSEWRVYVAHGEVLDVRFADHSGDKQVQPDLRAIAAAVTAFTASGTAPAGYVIDFGVTRTGATALVEVNDGFSFGAYDGVSAETVWEVTTARWQGLLSQAPVVVSEMSV